MTEAEDAKTPRERYRAQVRAEVKEHAWEQIAAAGASALSLNAIAKRMGMSGPALYRYFAGRDELITELIRDAYRSLADTFRATSEAGADVAALATALRAWALADPQRYFLVYGTPVPGYHAPDEITTIASEIMAPLLDACTALPSDGPTPLHRALTFWTRLHGVLSLELAGHFNGMEFDPAQFYAAEVEALVTL
ncbi:TetR/AcrR family transcriptional regulator [Streptomyces sp. DSM 40750]|uniref:TetR/AcrR family transcriptional regulator n=1 Tax=Streptomyces sp. DSM 40750 TaxID=2801030 RepID=UPI00214B8AD5|nr:TetR/AcrR family transcriptional regulator [Streptomyces sp. DSM 40750]UUU22235.1 TetR/AcrR family transcriptional regulator [Streptomyces sp. DSM 40750]